MRNTAVFVSLSNFRAKAPGAVGIGRWARRFQWANASGLCRSFAGLDREGVLEVFDLGPVAQLVRARA